MTFSYFLPNFDGRDDRRDDKTGQELTRGLDDHGGAETQKIAERMFVRDSKRRGAEGGMTVR